MADRVVQSGVGIREMSGRTGVAGLDSDSAERTFWCSGSDDPTVVRDALLTQGFYQVWEYDNLVLSELTYERRTNEAWEFTASYANVPKRGSYTVSIDTTGGLVKQTEAFAQTAYPASGMTAVDYGTSIDVQDGEPQGVERIIPTLKLDITARIHHDYVTDAIGYAKTVASLTGQTNNSTYLTFAQGELLFAGATGPIITDRDATLTFTFHASSNLSGYTIGSISGITKAGHDYLWVSYMTKKDSTTKRKTKTARAAYVSRVYGEADFSSLKIGETP